MTGHPMGLQNPAGLAQTVAEVLGASWPGYRLRDSARLQARHDEPSLGASAVDQLLGRKPRPRTEVGEVTLHGARPDAHELGRLLDRPAGGDVGGEDIRLARRRTRQRCAAQVPVSHALRAVAGRDSLGVRLIIRKRSDC